MSQFYGNQAICFQWKNVDNVGAIILAGTVSTANYNYHVAPKFVSECLLQDYFCEIT